MMRARKIVVLILLMIPFLLAGCSDQTNLDKIEESQKEILTRLNTIEENQTKLNNIEDPQKEILTRLSAIEKNQKNIQKDIQKLVKPRRQAVDYNKVNKIPLGKSAVKGKKDAPVTIVEFSDFQCPYCSKLQSTLREVLKAYPDDVKLVFKDFPLSFHKYAKDAAKAARAAGEQGKYWEMHDIIFENFNKLNNDVFKGFAEKLNLDTTRFMADYKSKKYDNLIQQDINLGKSIGVTGTPTLFFNGKRMQRRSFDDFKTLIEGYLKKK